MEVGSLVYQLIFGFFLALPLSPPLHSNSPPITYRADAIAKGVKQEDRNDACGESQRGEDVELDRGVRTQLEVIIGVEVDALELLQCELECVSLFSKLTIKPSHLPHLTKKEKQKKQKKIKQEKEK